MFNSIANWFTQTWQEFYNDFDLCFIQSDRWKSLLSGLENTIIISFFAVIIGIVLGVIIAAIRSTYDKNHETYEKRHDFFTYIIKFLNWLCNLYTTIIRGTPVVVQLMMLYFVIFASYDNSIIVAIIAFGLNSAGYVSEIVRGGIMSIDNGQFEAGRSLGLNYFQTMIYIIIPQAFKVVLPSLANEFIVLIKETSIAGYVAITDLTKAGDIIRGRTFSPFLPLLAVALIYLIIVIFLTKLVKILERKLRKNEREHSH